MSTEIVPAEQEPSGLIRLALEKGVGVDVLKGLLDLQERVTERNARQSFFQALSDFQSEVGSIPKTSAIAVTRAGVEEIRSRYAALDTILQHIRPLLKKHGFIVTWDSVFRENGNVCITCYLRHVEGHTEHADFEFPQKDASAPGMNGVQIAGSARTYGERYSLIQVLGLTTADPDDDAQEMGDGATISRDQISELDVKIQTTHTDKAKFLEFLGVSQLSEIPVRDYTKAMNALKLKEEQNRAKAAAKAAE